MGAGNGMGMDNRNTASVDHARLHPITPRMVAPDERVANEHIDQRSPSPCAEGDNNHECKCNDTIIATKHKSRQTP